MAGKESIVVRITGRAAQALTRVRARHELDTGERLSRSAAIRMAIEWWLVNFDPEHPERRLEGAGALEQYNAAQRSKFGQEA